MNKYVIGYLLSISYICKIIMEVMKQIILYCKSGISYHSMIKLKELIALLLPLHHEEDTETLERE